LLTRRLLSQDAGQAGEPDDSLNLMRQAQGPGIADSGDRHRFDGVLVSCLGQRPRRAGAGQAHWSRWERLVRNLCCDSETVRHLATASLPLRTETHR
jgi:hypothetical protein